LSYLISCTSGYKYSIVSPQTIRYRSCIKFFPALHVLILFIISYLFIFNYAEVQTFIVRLKVLFIILLFCNVVLKFIIKHTLIAEAESMNVIGESNAELFDVMYREPVTGS